MQQNFAIRAVEKLADRISRTSWGRQWFNDVEAETKNRANSRASSPLWLKTLAQSVAAVILLSLLALFGQLLSQYLEWGVVEPQTKAAAFDLTGERIEWTLQIGQPNGCKGLNCFREDLVERSVVLPMQEFPVEGYEVGSGDPILYRTRVTIPAKLRSTTESLHLYSLFVWAERYEVYVNGTLIETGAKEALEVPLPRNIYSADGKIDVAIRAFPGDLPYQGISNYGNVLIAPKSHISPLLRDTYHLQYTYPLMFYLPRVCFAALFCFVFLFMPYNREHLAFLLFAAVGAVKFAFLMDYTGHLLPSGVDNRFAYNMIYPLEQWLFAVFLFHFFRKHQRLTASILYSGSFLLAFVAIFAITAWGDPFNENWMLHVPRWLKLLIMVYGFALSLETLLFVSWTRRSPSRVKAALILLMFFLAGMAIVSADLTGLVPKNYRDFVTYSSELVFFLIFAGITSLDMGNVTARGKTSEAALGRVVDKRVASQLISHGGEVAAHRRKIVVLFADIRNFTPMSEGMTPPDLFNFLNEFFAAAVPVMNRHGGIVDKIIGDCLMVTFGAFDEVNDMHYKAACASVELRAVLQEFRRKAGSSHGHEVRLGIGLHTGLAAAGGLGDESRQDLTVIGDTVNTASRLEATTKEYGVDIVISAEMAEDLDNRACYAEVAKEVQLKGRRSKTDIYQLLAFVEEDGTRITHRADIDEKLASAPSAAGALPPDFVCHEEQADGTTDERAPNSVA